MSLYDSLVKLAYENPELRDDLLPVLKEHDARFEKGKPADPTKNMSPEDAEKWEEMKEEHGDKFKNSSRLRQQLVRLGDESPELREDLRPVLDALSGRKAKRASVSNAVSELQNWGFTVNVETKESLSAGQYGVQIDTINNPVQVIHLDHPRIGRRDPNQLIFDPQGKQWYTSVGGNLEDSGSYADVMAIFRYMGMQEVLFTVFPEREWRIDLDGERAIFFAKSWRAGHYEVDMTQAPDIARALSQASRITNDEEGRSLLQKLSDQGLGNLVTR